MSTNVYILPNHNFCSFKLASFQIVSGERQKYPLWYVYISCFLRSWMEEGFCQMIVITSSSWFISGHDTSTELTFTKFPTKHKCRKKKLWAIGSWSAIFYMEAHLKFVGKHVMQGKKQSISSMLYCHLLLHFVSRCCTVAVQRSYSSVQHNDHSRTRTYPSKIKLLLVTTEYSHD